MHYIIRSYNNGIYKTCKIEYKMDIDIPTDLLANKDKIRIIEDGVIKSGIVLPIIRFPGM